MNIATEPWFRWMPGMNTNNGRVWSIMIDGSPWGAADGYGDHDLLPSDSEPDTADPATIGCLTALMQELLPAGAYPQSAIYVAPDLGYMGAIESWSVWGYDRNGLLRMGKGETKVDAIITACRKAWENRKETKEPEQ